MAVTPSYREYVEEQLSRVVPIRSKSMFGGVGLYSGDLFFAVIAGDVLYFKVDESNRPDFEARGMGPFYPFEDRSRPMQYYEVPGDVLDDVESLEPWVEKALAVARTKRKRG